MMTPGFAAAAPARTLEVAERLVLWAVRERRASGPDSPVLVVAFRHAFGLVGMEQALAALESIFVVLWSRGDDELQIMPPPHPRVSAGESSLLRVCAEVQAGHTSSAVDLASPLVGPVWAPVLCEAASGLVTAMAEQGLSLPPPARPGDEGAAWHEIAMPRSAHFVLH